MTGVTLPSSMSPVSVMRFCFFSVHPTVSAMTIRWEASGAIASAENMWPAGCSHRPAGPPTATRVPLGVSTRRQADIERVPAMSSTRS